MKQSIVLSVNSKNERKIWIDIFKGLAILLVVLGHLEIPDTLYRFIFSFHMYAFFFVSGVTFNIKEKQSFVAFLRNEASRLLVPYLFFGFLWDITNTIIELYINGSVDLSVLGVVKNIADVLTCSTLFKSGGSVGATWFLVALFVVKTVFWLLVKLSKNNRVIIGSVCCIFFITGMLCNKMFFLPFKLFSTLTAYVFMYIGYISPKNFKPKKRGFLLIIACCFFVITFIASKYADCNLILTSNTLPKNPVLILVSGIFGCYGLVFLSMILENVKGVVSALTFYGVNSLIVMGTHSEINMFLRLIFHILNVPQLLRVVLIMIITMFVSIPICIIFNKYFPVIVGKKTNRSNSIKLTASK